MRGTASRDGKKKRKPGPARTRRFLDAYGREREAPRLSEIQLVVGDLRAPIGSLKQQGIGFMWKGVRHWCGAFSLGYLGDGDQVMLQVANRLAFIEYGQGTIEQEKPMGRRRITRALCAVWRKDGELQQFLASVRRIDDEEAALITVRDVIES